MNDVDPYNNVTIITDTHLFQLATTSLILDSGFPRSAFLLLSFFLLIFYSYYYDDDYSVREERKNQIENVPFWNSVFSGWFLFLKISTY